MNAPLIHSLEARYYTDPAIYKAELKGLLSRTWQFAGHASQIPNVGDYFAFEIAGQNLFAIRGRDQVIRTFYNVCQHRAHEMVTGTGNTRVVVCPYHAWTYELTGHLRAGPNIKSVPGFEREKICLTEVRTEDFNGFIFVNLDNDAARMDEWFPGVREEIREFVPHIDNLAPLEWVEVPENCNWKVSVENYSECYHCPMNHPTFAEGVVKPETYDIQPDPDGSYVLRHTTECQSLDRMTYPIDLSVPHAGDYQSWFLWPMFSFQCYPGNVSEHLSLARNRRGQLHCLARLVHRRRRRKRCDTRLGGAGPPDHRGGRYPPGGIGAARAAVPRLPSRAIGRGSLLRSELGTFHPAASEVDARSGRPGPTGSRELMDHDTA